MENEISITTCELDQDENILVVQKSVDTTINNTDYHNQENINICSEQCMTDVVYNISKIAEMISRMMRTLASSIEQGIRQCIREIAENFRKCASEFAILLRNVFMTWIPRSMRKKRGNLLSLRNLWLNTLWYVVVWKARTEYRLFWSDKQRDSRLQEKGPYRINTKRCVPKLI